MSTSNLINVGILLLGAIALLVTVLQARDARASKVDADRDRRAAADSATAAAASAAQAADALTRTATATEDIAGSGSRSAIALERIAEPKNPFSLERIHPGGMQWMLRNTSGQTLVTKRIAAIDPDEQRFLRGDVMDLLEENIWSPNESEILTFDGGTIDAPGHVRFAIEYRTNDTDHLRWKGLLG